MRPTLFKTWLWKNSVVLMCSCNSFTSWRSMLLLTQLIHIQAVFFGLVLLAALHDEIESNDSRDLNHVALPDDHAQLKIPLPLSSRNLDQTWQSFFSWCLTFAECAVWNMKRTCFWSRRSSSKKKWWEKPSTSSTHHFLLLPDLKRLVWININ